MTGIKISVLYILMIYHLPMTKSDCYTSVYRMKKAHENEGTLLQYFEDNVLNAKEEFKYDSEREIMKDFRSFVQSVRKEYNDENHPKFMEHPLNILHVMKRMTIDWEYWINKFSNLNEKSDFTEGFLLQVEAIQESDQENWPSQVDVLGTRTALVRLSDVYLLSFDDLAKGTINSTKSYPLPVDEFFHIGRRAIEVDMYYTATRWLNYTCNILKKGAISKEANLRSAMRSMATAYYRLGNTRHALDVIEEANKIFPDSVTIKSDLKYYKQVFQDLPDKNYKPVKKEPQSQYKPWRDLYQAMCRNDIKKSKMYNAKLKCYHRKSLIPYRPADVEVVNLAPEIVVYHRVIGEKEMQTIKGIASRKMSRSCVIKDTGDALTFSDTRVSESAWLDDSDDKAVEAIAKRVELMTGYSAKVIVSGGSHAEQFQILNYGIGGMYEPHYDYFDESGGHKWKVPQSLEGSGNRIATWMFYMNDIDAGGATVFPIAKAYVPVVKGGAVFWKNLYRNGSYDTRTLHAGCPVLIGSKWVSNKWFHEAGQWNKRPCSLDRFT